MGLAGGLCIFYGVMGDYRVNGIVGVNKLVSNCMYW